MEITKTELKGCPAVEIRYDNKEDGIDFVGRYNKHQGGVVGYVPGRGYMLQEMTLEEYEAVAGPLQYPAPEPGTYQTGYCYNCGSCCYGDCGDDYQPEIKRRDAKGNITVVTQPQPKHEAPDKEIVACEDGQITGAMTVD